MKAWKFNKVNLPEITELSNALFMRWLETDENFTKRIDEHLECLKKRHAEEIWKHGYRPMKTEFMEERDTYDKNRGIGLTSDVHNLEKTYAQRFYPLVYELENRIWELEHIKRSFWYRLGEIFGFIKPYQERDL